MAKKLRPNQIFRKPQIRPPYDALNDKNVCYFITAEWWVPDRTPTDGKQRWHKVSANEVIDIPPTAYSLVMLSGGERPGFAVTMVQEIPRRLFDWYNRAREIMQVQKQSQEAAEFAAADEAAMPVRENEGSVEEKDGIRITDRRSFRSPEPEEIGAPTRAG